MAQPTNPEAARPSLIKSTPVLLTGAGAGSVSALAVIPAMGVSASLHVLIVVGFALVLFAGPGKGDAADSGNGAAAIVDNEDDSKKNDQLRDSDFDPTDPFEGNLPFTPPGKFEEPGPDPKPPGDVPGGPPIVEVPPGWEFPGIGKGSNGVGPDFEPSGLANFPGGFMLRVGDGPRARLGERGGNKKSEAAVARGLLWLSLHQARDGHWAMDNFQEHIEHEDGKEVSRKCNCEGGALHDNIAGTAFALLPFLGAGLTPDNGKGGMFDYSKQIDNGLRYLIKNQLPDGRYADRSAQQENNQYVMYNHAIATICMCEAASLYPKDSIRNSAQRAIDYLIKAQDSESGGWRYAPPPMAGDTSVVGWCVMALESGRLAGLRVPSTAFDKVKHFLDHVESQTSDGIFYGYTESARPSHTLTAVGLLCRMYMGWKREDPRLVKGWRWLKNNNLPDPKNPPDLYFQYYATQVMHHMGGDPDDNSDKTKEFRDGWKQWNEQMRDMLIDRQDKGDKTGRPHQAGSWAADGDRWCQIGGRVMMTSLCLLTLEVYYRHLPLYRVERGEK